MAQMPREVSRTHLTVSAKLRLSLSPHTGSEPILTYKEQRAAPRQQTPGVPGAPGRVLAGADGCPAWSRGG